MGLIVRPTEAPLDWLSSIEPNMDWPEFFDDEPEIYLVPEMEPEDVEAWLRKNFLPIFKNFLFGWYEDESLWPKDLSYSEFERWFIVEVVDMVWDKQGK
jgi:hypothetical protein